MCHETTARPPLPPIAGGAGVASSEPLILEAADGNPFRAFTATAIDPEAAGIVILPDVRGLHPFYKDLAIRFAEVGIHSTAMDYFGRTAGIGERDEDFDFMAHVQQVTTDGLRADVAAAVAHVRSEAGGSSPARLHDRVLHGRAVLVQPGGGSGARRCGRVLRRPPGTRSRRRSRADRRCAGLSVPGPRAVRRRGRGHPRDAIDRVHLTLDEAGVPNEMVVYEGAPHSLFDRSFEDHREACDDAWRRVLAFVLSGPV